MMTQEEYVNEVLALRRQGKTITEIAEELEYHPATISPCTDKPSNSKRTPNTPQAAPHPTSGSKRPTG